MDIPFCFRPSYLPLFYACPQGGASMPEHSRMLLSGGQGSPRIDDMGQVDQHANGAHKPAHP